MAIIPENSYQTVVQAHKKCQYKKAEKTADKIAKAMEKAAESALKTLSEQESLSLKEQKELLSLLMKLVEHMAKMAPALPKPFTPTLTDKALLELYVQQHTAGALPGTL